jgi:delta8-fatty-acid desaturase
VLIEFVSLYLSCLCVFALQDEVKAKVAAGRLWVIIDSGVYDLTGFAARHPGGELALQHSAGQQVGDLFAEYHPASTYTLLPSLQVGRLAAPSEGPSDLAADRRALRQQLLAEGLFESRPLYFLLVLARAFCFLGLTAALLLTANHWSACPAWLLALPLVGPALLRLVAAVSFGMFFQQMAFLGHDSGHSGITHNRKLDSLLGMLAGNLCTGISMAWWKVSFPLALCCILLLL